MTKKTDTTTKAETPAEAQESPRGRPGRRSVADRVEAVKALLAGKASVEQLARRYAVTEETIEGWRSAALEGIEAVFRGNAESEEERKARRENEQLKSALTRTVMEKELLQRALDQERDKRPTGPSRWRK